MNTFSLREIKRKNVINTKKGYRLGERNKKRKFLILNSYGNRIYPCVEFKKKSFQQFKENYRNKREKKVLYQVAKMSGEHIEEKHRKRLFGYV